MITKVILYLEVCLLLFIALANGFQQREIKSTVGPIHSKTSNEQSSRRLDSEDSLKKEEALSLAQFAETNENNGFIEVKENEIPEGSLVYVLEEPVDQPVDGEILKTANNIVFRPLFRYRSKQEAQRRNSNRIRRRYFVPSRSYRHTYHSPYYYGHRYYK